MANEFGYTIQNLPKTIESVSAFQPEPIQFGPEAGSFPEGFVTGHKRAKKEFQRLARRALRLQSQAYLDAISPRLWGLERMVFYIPSS